MRAMQLTVFDGGDEIISGRIIFSFLIVTISTAEWILTDSLHFPAKNRTIRDAGAETLRNAFS